ncbi:MAG: cytochrome c, partial [Bacteroidota bacterium]
LGKNAPFPDFSKIPKKELINVAFDTTEEEIENGSILYGQYCGKCHGGGIIPDLKYSSEQTFNAFQQIVGEGALLSQGMPNFGDRLTESQIADIKHYILSEAKSLISS